MKATKPLGTRMISFDSRHKIIKNVPYSSYLRGKHLLRRKRVKQAEKSPAKRLATKLFPPLGAFIDATETLKDIRTIATKGKSK